MHLSLANWSMMSKWAAAGGSIRCAAAVGLDLEYSHIVRSVAVGNVKFCC